MSNIGVAHTWLDPRSAENIEGAQVIDAQNIGGARAPVPPLFLRPWVGTWSTKSQNSLT